MAQGARGGEDETKARVRVAMAYGNRTWADLARKFGISKSTVERWLHEDSTSGEARREKLAQFCNVPPWFMASGFEGLDEELDRRVEEVVAIALRRRAQEAQERRGA